MRRLFTIVSTALAVSILGTGLSIDTLAATIKTITSVSLKVSSGKLTAGDRLPDIQIDDPEASISISSNSSRYRIAQADWVTSTGKDMTIGEEPKMEVTLMINDSDEYAFKGSYQSSNVTISGGSYVSARRDGNDCLIVTLKVKPIKGTYNAPGDAYWKDSGIGSAQWEEPDYSSGAYDVYLYRGSSIVKKVEGLKARSYNFYPYMTQEGTYSFRVRTVPSTDKQKEYGQKSEWIYSDEYYLPKEKVSDGSGQNQNTGGPGVNGQVGWIKENNTWYFRYPDGTYVQDNWAKIHERWYLFDAQGVMLTGWNKRGDLWYYLNQSAEGTEGAMKTGWLRKDNKWYYLNPDPKEGVEGAVKIGWISYQGKHYFADATGALVEGWYQVDGNWYYFYPGDGAKAVDTTIDIFRVDENGIWRKE